MGKKLTILFLAIGMLSGLSGFYVVNGLQAYRNLRQNTIALAEHCGGQSPVHICVKAPDSLYSAYYPSYVTTQNPLLFVITLQQRYTNDSGDQCHYRRLYRNINTYRQRHFNCRDRELCTLAPA